MTTPYEIEFERLRQELAQLPLDHPDREKKIKEVRAFVERNKVAPGRGTKRRSPDDVGGKKRNARTRRRNRRKTRRSRK